MRNLVRPRAARAAVLLAGFALVVGAQAAAWPAQAAAAGANPRSDPYAPAYHHPYRHGAVPTIAGYHQMLRWISNHRLSHALGGNLTYHGGVDGIGVTTGHEQVYLVFYGSQWGTQGTNGLGNVTLSGDPSGEASYVQQLFKGLGTGTDLWSGVMTQYCQGVAAGTVTCPGSAAHAGYPTGGPLAGVWVDEGTAAPVQATGHQLAAEAVSAAAHFGNTTAAANRNAQYVILSPTGTFPDGFHLPGGNFCAWHDYNGDTSLSGGGAAASPYGDVAFTNMPYLTDAGVSCGQHFVNGGGTTDGLSIVGGHEYAETITDQNPGGGWWDSSGQENGDKCAWITPGTAGGSFDLALPTGTFAMQTTWGNDGNGGAGACQASHAIVTTGGGNTVTVTSPGNQTGVTGHAVSLQLHASDSASGQTLTWSATGLPAGLSISTSGLITGTPTTATTASVAVRATDTTSASGSASFSWAITAASGCSAAQLLGNPGFEAGSITPWAATPGVRSNVSQGIPVHSGTWAAWLDGYTSPHTDGLGQTVTIPAGCHTATFSFWLNIQSNDPASSAYDTLRVQVLSSGGAVLGTLATYSNLNAGGGYVQRSFSLAPYIGQRITLAFTGTQTLFHYHTSFFVDDNALTVS